MAIGLVYGRKTADDVEAKEIAYQKAGEYVRAFKSVNGHQDCRDLLGIDVWDDEGLIAYRARNLKSEICLAVVGNAVRLVLGLISENNSGTESTN